MDRMYNDETAMIETSIIPYDDGKPIFKYQMFMNELHLYLIDFLISLISMICPLIFDIDA